MRIKTNIEYTYWQIIVQFFPCARGNISFIILSSTCSDVMKRKKTGAFVKKVDLLERLQQDCSTIQLFPPDAPSKVKKTWRALDMLHQCAAQGHVTDEELLSTYPTQTSVIKCYLPR